MNTKATATLLLYYAYIASYDRPLHDLAYRDVDVLRKSNGHVLTPYRLENTSIP